MAQEDVTASSSRDLTSLLELGEAERLERLIEQLGAGEMAHALSRLDEPQQARLLTLLSPEQAAFVVDEVSHPQAADVLEEVPPDQAAAILEQMPSDEQADLLGELEAGQAEAIIAEMTPDEAEELRLLTSYGPETAGGLMITEYLAFFESMTIDDIFQDLRTHHEAYQAYDVQYVYIVNRENQLRGVIRLRDLVMSPGQQRADQIMIRDPLHVSVDTELEELEGVFDKYGFYALPVVDQQHRLSGVVRRSSVEEALTDRADRALLRFGGIIGGEEMRTMSWRVRCMRRLAFLLPNIGLNLLAVSVIAYFEPTIAAVTAMAIFLPLISDMGGNAGIQAIAVSMRELALGLIRVGDGLYVLAKEVLVGFFTGAAIGLVTGAIAQIMRPEYGWALGVVVGVAMMLNNVVAVVTGGVLPLLLKRCRIDPALASGPVLTTVTDFCGFLLALGLTALALSMEWLPAM